MSKTFWVIVMIFSGIITTWSGFFVFDELRPKAPVAVPLVPVPTPVPLATLVETSTVTDTAQGIAPMEAEATVIDEPASTEEAKRVKNSSPKNPSRQKTQAKTARSKARGSHEKKSIVLKYAQTSAKKVFVIADFNKWFRQPLKKEGNEWKVTVKLAPGTYQYVFVVDEGQNRGLGKRILDPNNPKSKDGKLSILTVKSSSSEN